MKQTNDDAIAETPKHTEARAKNSLIAPTNRHERRRSRSITTKLIKQTMRKKKKIAARKARAA